MENQLSMDAVLYKAVVVGNSSILEKSSTGIPYFCGRTLGANDNIIHIAVRHDHCTFVEEALRRFPELLCQKNSYNETPFHVAAKTGNTKILDAMLKSYKVEGVDIAVEATSHPPWRVKNSEGDTPLHVALIYSKIQFAKALVEEDPELALFLNNSGETPLHLAIKHHVDDDREAVIATMKLVANGPGATFVMRCPPKEDPLPVIKLLLDVNKGAACARDANGLTPLLRAASLDSPYISAIKTILDYCPESINVYDSSGKTMLHLLNELPKSKSHEDLLRIPELYGLKDYQDSQGNTPAHIAVKNRNIFVVQLLLRMSANFAIKNKEGVSAAYLIQRQIGDFNDLIIAKAEQLQIPYSTSQEEMRIVRLHARLTLAPDYIMSLSERNNHIPEPEHGNLQHWLLVACYYSLRKRNALTNCMKDAFDNYFSIHGANTLSGNPLHAMVRWIPEAIDHSMLELFEDHFKAIVEEAENPEPYSPPWMMKDKDANTPLHLAVIQAARCSVNDYEKSTMVKCIVEFLKFDARSLGCQNNKKETPLHLLSQVILSPEDTKTFMDARDQVTRHIPQNGFHWRNKDGLTPVLRAAQYDNFGVVKLLCGLDGCSSMLIAKEDGKTVWHLVAEKAPDELAYLNSDLNDLLQSIYGSTQSNPNVISMLYRADNDGNTPLHVAIGKGNFGFAESLINYITKVGNIDQVNILSIRNKKGVRIGDIIQKVSRIPHQIGITN